MHPRRLSFDALLGLVALAQLMVSASIAKAEPIPNNDYQIDLFQGPILAPLRVIGIAGAYAGYAEGIAGMVANAAAPAVREPYSVNWLELDLAASLSIPLELFENNDFDNSGAFDFDYSNFIYVTLGSQLQVGAFGFGLNGEIQRYTLQADNRSESTAVTLGKYHGLVGVRLIDGQLMLGGGARVITLGLDAPSANLTYAGIAPEMGLLIRPDWESFRLGATFRFPVHAGEFFGDGAVDVDAQGVRRAGGLTLPDEAVLPWELEVGLAVQVGPRPLNPAWINPRDQEKEVREALAQHRAELEERRRIQLEMIEDPKERALQEEQLAILRRREDMEATRELVRAQAALKRERRARYANWPREHLLITAELLMSGAIHHGVGLEQFLGQNQPENAANTSVIGKSGAAINFSPRFGIETEPVPGLVHTRFGSYYEPSRFGRVGRQHFTFGADQKLFTTRWWGLVPEVTYKLQASVDLAPRYESVSVGMGVWH